MKTLWPNGYKHPTDISMFKEVYKTGYQDELESCDRWIKWCTLHDDTHGINFHEGRRSALIFNNLKMEQLLRVLNQEPPNKKDE